MICLLSASPVRGHPELVAQIELIDEQLAEQPANTELLLRRGDLYRRHGDYSAAGRDFATVRTLEPANDRVDFYEGRLRLEMGNADGAEASLSRYLGLHPEHAAAWSLRGRARLARGQAAAAADDFGSAIANTERPTPSLYLEHGVALCAAGQAQWESARAAADAGLAEHPQDVALLGLATDISLGLGQGAAAAAYVHILPPVLRELPQWRSRIESVDCLIAGANESGRCIGPAVDRLARQVREQSHTGTMDSG